jgi:predicted nucleic acid-binding protein
LTYLDANSLLKLLVPEAESAAVQRAVETLDRAVVSTLTLLETEVQLRGALLGRRLTTQAFRSTSARLARILELAPFEVATLSGSIFVRARSQIRAQPRSHLRTLDRLHLAATRELGISRIMTHDAALARAASALGLAVTSPGR